MKGNASNVSVVVPGKTLNDLSKIITGGVDDMVTVYFTDRHILFEFENTIVVSRLLEGEYFKIVQMLSMDHKIKVRVNNRELMKTSLSTCVMQNHHVSSGMMQELISMLYYQSISMRGLINHG